MKKCFGSIMSKIYNEKFFGCSRASFAGTSVFQSQTSGFMKGVRNSEGSAIWCSTHKSALYYANFLALYF